jgi:soluble lytic murein transglycosylase-like protein
MSSLTTAVKKSKGSLCEPFSDVLSEFKKGAYPMSNTKLLAGLSAAVLAAAIFVAPAQASCRDNNSCGIGSKKIHHVVRKHVKQASLRTTVRHKARKHAQVASLRHHGKRGIPANRGPVIAMIKARAPSYGVPTWFALRIAQIESGYNPSARGAAGEYGVYQLKCQTARGLGYHGGCGGLLNASTNVNYGLKHLSQAVRSSRGNLRMAASKHNGGLGTKRIVKRYVAMVF